MPKFVPVVDQEKPRCEQDPNSESLQKHRLWEAPHIARPRNSNANRPENARQRPASDWHSAAKPLHVAKQQFADSHRDSRFRPRGGGQEDGEMGVREERRREKQLGEPRSSGRHQDWEGVNCRTSGRASDRRRSRSRSYADEYSAGGRRSPPRRRRHSDADSSSGGEGRRRMGREGGHRTTEGRSHDKRERRERRREDGERLKDPQMHRRDGEGRHRSSKNRNAERTSDDPHAERTHRMNQNREPSDQSHCNTLQRLARELPNVRVNETSGRLVVDEFDYMSKKQRAMLQNMKRGNQEMK
eukprot:GHVT01064675.1.p1 GENE.GHVT01064675.1~~GHVT01064675.1.p1  ORF type:complete len:300 (+),score=43.99 GHVT01064675.1:153-1052(+)